MQSAFILPPDRNVPLFIPRRSRQVPAEAWRQFAGEIRSEWQEIARRKGFRITRRVRDRYHLVLECSQCGSQTTHKLYTLRKAVPACTACEDRTVRETANRAGLEFLGYDPQDRHYGFYHATCGHILRREFELVARIAKGSVNARCETCLERREEQEAQCHGWQRLGRDPLGNTDYRLYRHECGHEQRIASVNMSGGHCDCARCGESWSARPSQIYLFEIRLGPAHYLKLGYSNDPIRRHRYQLGLPKTARVRVLRRLKFPSGNLACAAEKRAHAVLRRELPDAVVPQSEYAHMLNVVSEVYRPFARTRIEHILDEIAQNNPG
jgi:hypothetical protein